MHTGIYRNWSISHTTYCTEYCVYYRIYYNTMYIVKAVNPSSTTTAGTTTTTTLDPLDIHK